MGKSIKYLSILILSVLFYSCSEDNSSSEVSTSNGIEDVRNITILKVDDLKSKYKTLLTTVLRIPEAEADLLISKFKYDIQLSVVKYNIKDPFGNTRTLSGVVSYPILPDSLKDKKLRLYSYLHGTFYSDDQTFSSMDSESAKNQIFFLVSAHENGYVGVFPDYFGYGSDKENMHYYQHGQTLASASKGMIDLVPEYMQKKNINIDFDKLYLGGYSEGGFAAMSTLKSFSENGSVFKDFVTVAGAGAYDVEQTLYEVVKDTEGNTDFVASYAWVVMSYNKVYNINRDFERIFEPKYVDVLKKHDGKNSIFLDKESLPTVPSELLTSDFINGITSRQDLAFLGALKDNDISNFDAKGRVYLVHGGNDTWVPSFNTKITYDRLKARGVDVEKEIVQLGTHSYLTPYLWGLRFIAELTK